MGCIYNIPKEEYRHCQICTAERCDERPKEETTSATSVELSDPYKNNPIRCKARELYGAGSIFNEEKRGFIKGAEWEEKEIIKKAVSYFNSKFYFDNLFYGVVSTDFNSIEEMIEDFKQAMKGE